MYVMSYITICRIVNRTLISFLTYLVMFHAFDKLMTFLQLKIISNNILRQSIN